MLVVNVVLRLEELLAAQVSQDLKVQKIIGALKAVPKSPEVSALEGGREEVLSSALPW